MMRYTRFFVLSVVFVRGDDSDGLVKEKPSLNATMAPGVNVTTEKTRCENGGICCRDQDSYCWDLKFEINNRKGQ